MPPAYTLVRIEREVFTGQVDWTVPNGDAARREDDFNPAL